MVYLVICSISDKNPGKQTEHGIPQHDPDRIHDCIVNIHTAITQSQN